jgi:hypothetical protein
LFRAIDPSEPRARSFEVDAAVVKFDDERTDSRVTHIVSTVRKSADSDHPISARGGRRSQKIEANEILAAGAPFPPGSCC